MTTRIGINGLGRIGRCAVRQISQREDVELVGVNDLVDSDDIAYLLRNDSVHGSFPGEVRSLDSNIEISGSKVPFFSETNPADLAWEQFEAEIVIESTGAFRSREDAAKHLDGGARKVIISAPSEDADVTIVPGVNDASYDSQEHEVLSMASCTTNCVAPVLQVLHDSFQVEQGMFTTVHAYTSSQSLVDGPARKRRRGRAAAMSLVPTTTGAATATELVIPELAGRLDGMAIRAPVPDGSLVDLVVNIGQKATRDDVAEVMKDAASADLDGILGVSEDDLVSVDIIGNPLSALVDGPSISVLNGRQVKVIAWYDNEMGYAARLVDLAADIGSG